MLISTTQVMTARSPFRMESVVTELTTMNVRKASFGDVIAETHPNFLGLFFNVWR